MSPKENDEKNIENNVENDEGNLLNDLRKLGVLKSSFEDMEEKILIRSKVRKADSMREKLMTQSRMTRRSFYQLIGFSRQKEEEEEKSSDENKKTFYLTLNSIRS